jgi:hypothetical protein
MRRGRFFALDMLYNDGMTRAELQDYLVTLQDDRRNLVRQLLSCDAQSATLSSGSGSKSYTNRTVADLKAKIRFADAEIARVSAALGVAPAPGEIIPKYAEYTR